MSRHAAMSHAAMTNRMNRDQTSQYTLTLAERIAVKFETVVEEAKKLADFPKLQARAEMLTREYGNQLRLLAEYADEYAACFHIEEPPHSMRLHNMPADLLQQIVDELANDGEWLSIDEALSVTYGCANLTAEQIDRDRHDAEVMETRRSDYPI